MNEDDDSGGDGDEQPAPDFHLRGEDAGFTARCNDVFSSLDLLESQHKALQKVHGSSPVRTDNDECLWKPEPSVFETETIESRFKKPDLSKRVKTVEPKVAQKRKDCKNWVKYDLCDVTTDDLSEGGNSKAAYEFLDEQKKAKLSVRLDTDLSTDTAMEPESESADGTIIKKHVFRSSKSKLVTKSSGSSSNTCGAVKLASDDQDQEVEDTLNEPKPVKKCESSTSDDKIDNVTESSAVFRSRKSRKANIRSRNADEVLDE